MENLEELETKDLAFLDYFNKDGVRQFSVFACENKSPDGNLYYRDIDSEIVYTLENDNGERMQESPVLVNNYYKKVVKFGKDDLLFKAESSGSTAGDFKYPSNEEFANRFQSLTRDMKIRDAFKFKLVAGKLRKDEIGEKELTELVKAINENEKRLFKEGKNEINFSFKELFRENVRGFMNNFSGGLENFEEKYYNGCNSDDEDQMGE